MTSAQNNTNCKALVRQSSHDSIDLFPIGSVSIKCLYFVIWC